MPRGTPGLFHPQILRRSRSFVLEVEPPTKRVVWVYEDRERFHSNYTSSCQRLTNGNTMICEAAGRRVF